MRPEIAGKSASKAKSTKLPGKQSKFGEPEINTVFGKSQKFTWFVIRTFAIFRLLQWGDTRRTYFGRYLACR